MNKLLLLALVVLTALPSFAAEDFSYVYIQGDKQTPFYVKLEDGMQPRYGKNYCILSRLAPGPANIEILFQQNAFPAQKFAIQVPERGSRQFMIVRRDGGFSLYDLQQNFYLPAGNKISDDHAPAAVAGAAEVSVYEAPQPEKKIGITLDKPGAPKSAEPGVFSAGVKKTGAAIAKGRDKSAEFARKAVQPLRPAAATESPEPQRATDGSPSFIGGLELATPNSAPGTVSTRATTPKTVASQPLAPIVNSDCPNALNASDFGKVFNGLSAYNADEDRLEYFGKQLDKCYETWQARTLATKLQGDAARYELLRKIYPRITDQGAFPLLDDLLSSPVWKDAFNRLVKRS